ncbi:protease inhibitor [Citrobacter koseri]|uniref:Protease inhibitor n=1 Tax=Citrobacter koseri TaxID=545 RepID=A0A2X2VN58_CITKO|nr:protease inhibitor [Citrobacter koseri]
MALNVNDVDVNFFRVKPESLAAFVSQWEYRNALSNWESDNLLKMADLVYTGRFDLNPARNTREKTPCCRWSDIKPLQQAGVYIAVMNQAGHYNYSNPATLFTLSDIGVSAHRYHNRLDIFTQSLENGAAQQGVEVALLDEKGQTLAQAASDAQGHVQLENSQQAALLLARKDGQTTLLDLKLPALDLAEFAIAGAPGYSKQFFMFGPRDLYRPGETVILNGLLRDSDGKTLPDQPVKLEVVKPDGQVLRTVVSQPENGLYRFTYPLDSGAPTGMWHIRANTGDNQPRMWDFHVEDFMPERMALNLSAQKTPLAPVGRGDVLRCWLLPVRSGLPMATRYRGNSSCARSVKRYRRCRASSLAILQKKTFPAVWTKSSLRWMKMAVATSPPTASGRKRIRRYR